MTGVQTCALPISASHITVSDVIEMVNEYDKDNEKIGMIQKGDIAEYCTDAINNGLDCRYLATVMTQSTST